MKKYCVSQLSADDEAAEFRIVLCCGHESQEAARCGAVAVNELCYDCLKGEPRCDGEVNVTVNV